MVCASARARSRKPMDAGPAGSQPKLQLHTFDSLNVVQVKSHATHTHTLTFPHRLLAAAAEVEDEKRAFPNRRVFFSFCDAILSEVVLS